MKTWKKMMFTTAIALVAVVAACAKPDAGTTQETATNTPVATPTPTLTPTPTPETTPSEKSFLPTEEFVRSIGRTQEVNDTLWLVHSGTGMEFTFTGTSATIKIKPDSSFTSKENQARIAVYVNGERVIDDMVDKMEMVYTVFESDTPEECIVRVVKLSEAAQSTFGVTGLEVTCIGDIRPTEASDKLIEFIGDSITCGYGVDDEDYNHHFSTTTEDATKTYAYKTAEKLGADYSLVSLSGYGVVSGYSGNGEKVPEQTMPQYYGKLGYSGGTYLGDYMAQEQEWDFTKRQPDVIVVNLGTNDNSYTKTSTDRKGEFALEYAEFLKQVRDKNPDATIICTLGIMGAELYSYIKDAVEIYTEDTGDHNIYTMQFAAQSMSDGIAADWHPSEKTHEKAAEKLVATIKEVMGW